MATRNLVRWGVWLAALLPLSCGDDPPVNNGPAVAKFCHQFHRSGRDIDLTLVFGQPAEVSMTTSTGTCAPMPGMPCAGLPKGKVPVKLVEGDVVLMKTTIPLNSGGEFLAYPIVTGLDGLAIRMVPLDPKLHCDTIDPLPEVFSAAGLPMEPAAKAAIDGLPGLTDDPSPGE